MRVVLGEIATDRPMGQQAYEAAIRPALTQADPQLELVRRTVTSWRSGIAADRRIPWRLVDRLPASVAAASTSRWVYGRADLVHRLDLRLPPAAGPEVVTAHDLPGLRFPDEGAVPGFLASGARRAALVIVPSHFAGDELVELLGVERERIRVIPYGLSDTYRHPPPEPSRPLVLPPGRFVLHAAGATRRKNLAELAAAWADLVRSHPDLSLLLAGPPDDRRTALFASLPRTVLLGALPASDVAWLMSHAAAVVVPSLYEGFGLPALEGMAAGAPVVAARTSALPEVCGDGAELVDPHGPALAAGLRRVLDDEGRADELRRRGAARAADFSWQRAAEAHLQAYRDATA